MNYRGCSFHYALKGIVGDSEVESLSILPDSNFLIYLGKSPSHSAFYLILTLLTISKCGAFGSFYPFQIVCHSFTTFTASRSALCF